jgi:hypothetical protein
MCENAEQNANHRWFKALSKTTKTDQPQILQKQIRLKLRLGRAIAQAVSRLLPTAAVRVRSRVWSSGIYGGQSVAGAGFLRVLRVPLPIFIPPIAPQSPSPIIWGWYNRPEVTAVQGTWSHPTSNERKIWKGWLNQVKR